MGNDTAAPPRNFSLSVGDRLRALAQGPPAYMRRRRRIEDLEERLVRLFAAGVDPSAPDVVTAFAALNDLVDKHNRYYPIEGNLPVDPRTHRLLDRGVPWRPLPAVRLEDLRARAAGGNK
jgi:hypothetical protein